MSYFDKLRSADFGQFWCNVFMHKKSRSKWWRTNLTDLRDPFTGISESKKDAYRCFKKGLTKRETARRLHLHERTVGRWYERFDKEGDPKYWKDWRCARGAQAGSKVTGGKEDLIAHLRSVLHSMSPSDFGLPQAQWDVNALASYISRRYGRLPSLRTVYRYLKACSEDSAGD